MSYPAPSPALVAVPLLPQESAPGKPQPRATNTQRSAYSPFLRERISQAEFLSECDAIESAQ